MSNVYIAAHYTRQILCNGAGQSVPLLVIFDNGPADTSIPACVGDVAKIVNERLAVFGNAQVTRQQSREATDR